MPDFTTLRRAIWFTNIGDGEPGDLVTATYLGRDSTGRTDPLAGTPPSGPRPGKTYTVMLLSNSSKLLAPCPDFCNGGETPSLSKLDLALIRAAKNCAAINSGKKATKSKTARKVAKKTTGSTKTKSNPKTASRKSRPKKK